MTGRPMDVLFCTEQTIRRQVGICGRYLWSAIANLFQSLKQPSRKISAGFRRTDGGSHTSRTNQADSKSMCSRFRYRVLKRGYRPQGASRLGGDLTARSYSMLPPMAK